MPLMPPAAAFAYLKIAHLATLLAEAQDLPKSDRGWIKCSALSTYNGPSVPGNFDTHSSQIINTNTFVLTCHGLTQSLTDEYIRGIVAKDSIRGKNRFQLGLFARVFSGNAMTNIFQMG